ncbi:unnamed protein product [Cylindrotheca closterium]|uniref:G-protein coupled receptors family 1 profile domain-containing protein n=1 Tax=Cylindrotheca closterium TaxID=2856 RepID=A0AAD2CET1_9STRA|nr:unnamed protein product [Cylindrotheca closterium]
MAVNRLEDDSSSVRGGVKIEVREWELDENSTTYDRLVAAPSDATMESQWILFLTILVLSIVLMLFVFISMLRDKKTRRNSFNTYILFLMGPDIFFNFCCILSCGLNVHLGRYFSVDACVFQSLYCIFAITSSAWINAIVVYQLHRMLWCSRKAIRYHPPTRRHVAIQSCAVYVYSIFMATWSNWGEDESWWPIRNNVYSGVFCLPMPFDTESTMFFYLLYAPLVFVLPLLYICYVVVDMLYHNLLPDQNQRKTLMVFLRLLLVYFVMWVPALGLVFVGSNYLSTWYVVIGGAWAHLQGAVSAVICWFKPDIQRACHEFFWDCCKYVDCCYCCTNKPMLQNKETSHQDTEEMPSYSSREEPVLEDYDGVLEDGDDDSDIQYQIQKSCELFLGLSDDEDDLVVQGNRHEESPTKRGRSRRGSGKSRSGSPYESSMGLEPEEWHTITSGELVMMEGSFAESV